MMRSGLPSGTSLLVSFARGLGVDQQEIDAHLAQLTSLSAAGSQLAMTYRVPGKLPYGGIGRAAIPVFFAAAGEPLKGTLHPHELVSGIEAAWQVTYDADARGWKELTGSVANPSRSFLSERLAIGNRLG